MAILVGWLTGIAIALGIEHVFDIHSLIAAALLAFFCCGVTTFMSLVILD